ncbi:MAG: leucine--tRNA ligase [Candidatus Yonathbacteria bacterium]|nr:leucine--tRNA ligase [Candidatus Yonathbacteria bacterium]NTW47914.1 leucine--tRNA ligase [Candidatus Yonathbacteria bacterium]
MAHYDHTSLEKKWQKKWAEEHTYHTSEDLTNPKKAYILDMFPYPSGQGLHVGHPKGYIATDIIARKKIMEGYSVLHPMGWDAFGLPAENYALKTKTHPKKSTDDNVARYKEQLSLIGLSYDWEREINTTDPAYYKWTQWAFLKMFEKGLAYESYEPINWCPSCKTGLANEDLDGTVCERCGSEIEKKPMRQWVIKITDYADRLLAGVDALDWPEQIKESQRNWIGRSEGAVITFRITNQESRITDEYIEVFTTRADTLFGVSYCVIAPEHPLINRLGDAIENISRIKNYVKYSTQKTIIERTSEGRDKTGEKLEGIVAINPINGDEVPIFVADYVLGDYGTGAVMAVPAHDERDFIFTKKYQNTFDLKIKTVIDVGTKIDEIKVAHEKVDGVEISSNSHLFPDWFRYKVSSIDDIFFYTKVGDDICDENEGILVNSGEFTGLSSADAREKIVAALEEKGLGKKSVKYKLRDWVFSRQRYWGEPIPVVHCDACGVVAVPEQELPVTLPDVKQYEPTGTGESPLAGIESWVNTTCPKCGGRAKRETNTMPQWAGSSWYYLRYIDPYNDIALVDKEKEAYWMPVDTYVGGAEHATRHLIYARFWHKFLYDIGAVSGEEPFMRLQHVGLIGGEDGRKMSKRFGNVINPDDIIARFGADTLRVYEMFMGPFDQNIGWSTDNIMGARRFLERVWKLSERIEDEATLSHDTEILLHKTIQKVGDDIDTFAFNTAVSALMILVNALEKEPSIPVTIYRICLSLVAPFAPHMAEELFARHGGEGSIVRAPWPSYDKTKCIASTMTIAVQVNGKMRGTFVAEVGISEEEVTARAHALPEIKKHISDKVVKKTIYIKDKLVNFVVA